MSGSSDKIIPNIIACAWLGSGLTGPLENPGHVVAIVARDHLPALLGALLELSRLHPLLLVIEDGHAIDGESIELLHQLSAQLKGTAP